MIERIFLLIGGLSSKMFAAVVAGTSGLLGMLIGEAMTSQLRWSALAGGLATVFAGVVLVIPRVMEQRRKSKESAAKLQSDSITLLTNAHARDLAFYITRLTELELIARLHTEAKHAVINEWTAALNAYNILSAQLRALNIEPLIIISPKTYKELVSGSDEQITDIAKEAKKRVTETPPPALSDVTM